MKLTANESGNGKLTVRHLAELLQGLPDDAVITNMIARNDQRDGDIWSFSAEWEPSTSAPVNLRGFRTGSGIGDSLRRQDDERQHRLSEANRLANQSQFGDH